MIFCPLAFAADPAWDVDAPHGPGQDVHFDVREGTWLGVDVSPDGRTVLFDLLGDLYTVPIGGGDATRLTQGVAWDTDGHWSADGRRIAYTSDRGGNEELWTMAADGSGAVQVTHTDVDRWSDPVWAPEPGWLLGRRRIVDTRSIGVQELWLLHEAGGAGVKLTDSDADPHAGEAAFSPDGRYIWFSTRDKRFEYNENPHGEMWEIVRYDRQLGERTVVTDLDGSAARPTPSPDGKTLVFLRRDHTKTVLQAMDLATGRLRQLADWLDPDQLEGFELRSTYPRLDFTPDGKALVVWAGGKLWRLDVATRQRTEIPFHVTVDTRITDAARVEKRVDDGPVHAKMLRWPQVAPDGTVYVAGIGRIWALRGDDARPVTPDDVGAYFPTLSRDGKQLAWTSWSDTEGGYVWAGAPGDARRITSTPADVQAPAFSPDGQKLVWLRGSGATMRGHDLGEETRYDLVLGSVKGGDGVVLRSVPFRGSNERAPRPQFSADGTRILWLEDEPVPGRKPPNTVLKSCDLAGRDERVHLRLPGAEEVRLSADGAWVVFKREHQGWVAPMPALGNTTVELADLPTRELTDEAGDFLDVFGGRVTWSHGDQLYSVPLDGLVAAGADTLPTPTVRTMKVEVPRAIGRGTVAFTNARIVTEDDAGVIDHGTLVVKDRRIVAVGADVLPPPGADVLDVGGRTIVPGLVDVHAHLHYASGDVFPQQEWRHLCNLAYGVTTTHDPSASTDLVFGQAELIEAGKMIGPRSYSTGYILYGALDNQGAKITSYEDAEKHILRLLHVGAWSVKSYQQPRRTQRQWIVEAARKLGVLDVPEGGGDLFMNLGMVLDGHSSVEHALPVAPIYDDIVQLWSRAQTTYTPTLIVAYGGPFGEVEQYQDERVWEDPRLRRYTPPDVLMARAYRLAPYLTDATEFRHHLTAQGAARLARAGVNVALGGHGQLQGLGPHWELEMLGMPGAMTPAEALYAGTMGGAKHLGLDQDLGSLRAGKLADLAIVDGDPLADLKNARNVVWVMKDGILYDALTMNRLHPDPETRPPMIWEVAQADLGR